ncbi:MAG TPA: YezD family protein [Candidatus Saccharimonadales bacterium]|nr:YezD family protein [Candidatus Saccharimonadales bacterium]
MNAIEIKPADDAGGKTDWLELIRQQVGSLRYGMVQITVHDSRVTQVEKTERVRLEHPQKSNTDQKAGGA